MKGLLSLAIVPPKVSKKDVNHARRERSAHDAESELRRMRSLGHRDGRGRNHRKKGEIGNELAHGTLLEVTPLICFGFPRLQQSLAASGTRRSILVSRVFAILRSKYSRGVTQKTQFLSESLQLWQNKG